MTRFVCCNSAAPVGGMASIDLALVVKICFLVESYVSRSHMKSSLKFNELVDKVENTAMTSLYTGKDMSSGFT